MYVNNHSIHVEFVQECHFLEMNKSTSKIIQDLDAENMLTLLDFGPEKQHLVIITPTISIY